jgi:hypothetical protein
MQDNEGNYLWIATICAITALAIFVLYSELSA